MAAAMIVSKAHLAYIVKGAIGLGVGHPLVSGGAPLVLADGKDVMNLLGAQNVESFNEAFGDALPAPSHVFDAKAGGLIELGQLIKACHCFHEQAKHATDYNTSPNKNFLDAVIAAALAGMPEYTSAKWHIEEGSSGGTASIASLAGAEFVEEKPEGEGEELAELIKSEAATKAERVKRTLGPDPTMVATPVSSYSEEEDEDDIEVVADDETPEVKRIESSSDAMGSLASLLD